MKKTGFIEGFVRPFYSRDFYCRAAGSSAFVAWLNLLLVIALISGFRGHRLWVAAEHWMTELLQSLDQELSLNFTEGRLTVNGLEQPYYSTPDSANGPKFIIDTTGTITELPPTGEIMLLTAHEFISRSPSGEEKTLLLEALRDLPQIDLDHATLVEYVPNVSRAIGWSSAIFGFFWIFIVKLVKWILFNLIYVVIRAAFGLRGLTNSFSTVCTYVFIPFSVISVLLHHYDAALPRHYLTINLITFIVAVILCNLPGNADNCSDKDPWEGNLEKISSPEPEDDNSLKT